jgi:hypothetical protein
VEQSNQKRDELGVQRTDLAGIAERLNASVVEMEGRVRELFKAMPDPLQEKLEPLRRRIPDDPASTKASLAERFQNVLGILNELNKANNEIHVAYEVRNVAEGKTSEVQSMYVGLAQAYYLAPSGEAGIGRPGPDGWTWEPSKSVAPEVLTALEIIQGKQTPAFVPLPIHLR